MVVPYHSQAALRARRPALAPILYTRIAPEFFRDSGVGPFVYRDLVCDVGMAQATALKEDVPATLAALAGATSRIVYDLHRFYNTQKAHPTDPTQWQPAVAATIARETHLSEENGTPSRLQVSFSSSDGFGREIQKKIQAEPGPAPKRDASGKIIVGADGLPVDEVERDAIATIPAGRLGEPRELALAMLFLASPAASYVNGVNFPVDGGRLAAQ